MAKEKANTNGVENFYEHQGMKEFLTSTPNPCFDSHHINVPFRMLVVAASGGGKTTFLLNLINKMQNTFLHLHIVYKCSEPIYEFLEKKLTARKVSFYTKMSDLPTVDNMPNKGKSQLVVFDDQINEISKTQQMISEFFIRGRKKMLSMAYLTQSYFKVPKIIRLNINYLILLKLSSDRDLKLIVSDYGLGVDVEDLYKIYKNATTTKFNFLKIDIDESDNNKKFSHNWTGFYKISGNEDS